jgi:hypothetical protein
MMPVRLMIKIGEAGKLLEKRSLFMIIPKTKPIQTITDLHQSIIPEKSTSFRSDFTHPNI